MTPAKRASVAGAALLFICAWPPAVVEAAPERLRGMIDNGTKGEAVPDDLEVTVAQVSASGTELDKATVTLDANGRFVTPPLDRQRAETVIIATVYKGVSYQTTAEPGRGGVVRLRVFEPTRNEGVISIRSDTSVATREDEDELAVLHLLRVVNRSDRTFIGDDIGGRPAVIRLPVPSDAFDLRAVEGLTHEAIRDVEGGIASGDPVQPGESRLSYSYGVLAPGGAWSLGHPVEYPTTRSDVLVEPDLVVSSPGRNLGSLDFEGRRYRQFEFGPLLSGQETAVIVTPPATGLALLPIAGVVAGLVLLGLLLLRRRTDNRPVAEHDDEHQRLVTAIADLDDDFAAGRIDEDAYLSERKAIKRALLGLES